MRGVLGSNSSGTPATVVWSLKVVAVTEVLSPYTIAANQTGTLFTNTGAGAGVQFNLPAAIAVPAAGAAYLYGFAIDAVQIVTIQLAAGDTARYGGLVTSVAGNVSDNTKGACIWFCNIAANKWLAVFGYSGAWSFA